MFITSVYWPLLIDQFGLTVSLNFNIISSKEIFRFLSFFLLLWFWNCRPVGQKYSYLSHKRTVLRPVAGFCHLSLPASQKLQLFSYLPLWFILSGLDVICDPAASFLSLLLAPTKEKFIVFQYSNGLASFEFCCIFLFRFNHWCSITSACKYWLHWFYALVFLTEAGDGA